MKRFLRAILALCMCFAIVLSCAIPQAQAVGFSPAMFALDATNLIISGARALGIGPGDDPFAFNTLITDAKESLFPGVTPLVNVWLDYVDNGFRAFLSADFLANLLAFFFDSGALEIDSGSSLTFTVSSGPHGSGYYSCYQPFWVRAFSCNGQYVYFFACESSQSVYFYKSGSSSPYGSWNLTQSAYPYLFNAFSISSSSVGDIPYLGDFTGKINYSTNVGSMTRDLLVNYPSVLESVVSSSDLTLDSVSDSLSGSAYSDWTAGAITQEDQPYVPVSIPSLSDSAAVSTQSQAQAQAGTVPDSVADEIIAGSEAVPDTDTGTLAGVIDAIQALPQTLADLFTGIKDAVLSIPQAIADVFSPPAVSESFQISLSSFFPFCIPFDLYNLLDALAAAPEAPVINGVIPVPTFGQTYEIEVDLTPWDNVAALFRTLQLGLFIVGLALVTRERFLRS